jgi:hypothetical protein
LVAASFQFFIIILLTTSLFQNIFFATTALKTGCHKSIIFVFFPDPELHPIPPDEFKLPPGPGHRTPLSSSDPDHSPGKLNIISVET